MQVASFVRCSACQKPKKKVWCFHSIWILAGFSNHTPLFVDLQPSIFVVTTAKQRWNMGHQFVLPLFRCALCHKLHGLDWGINELRIYCNPVMFSCSSFHLDGKNPQVFVGGHFTPNLFKCCKKNPPKCCKKSSQKVDMSMQQFSPTCQLSTHHGGLFLLRSSYCASEGTSGEGGRKFRCFVVAFVGGNPNRNIVTIGFFGTFSLPGPTGWWWRGG